MATRLITIELVGFGIGKEYQVVPPAEARNLLMRRMARGWHYRLTPPDRTGELPNDEERYAADCQACGIGNVYATV